MLEVEILASEAMSKLGVVPKAAIDKVKKKAKINKDRINEIEKTVKHDVIAFLTSVVETVGPEARFLHKGMTSSDVLDTSLAVQMRQACLLLIKETKELMKITKKLALKYKYTPTMGRSHGVHAEPTTFGLKVANWYSELSRSFDRLNYALETISYGAISGAVGTFAHLSPKVEEYVCKKLNLKPEPVSTQIVPRDRHSIFLSTIAHVGSNLERIALEIRHLQRTEVAEAEEPFTKGQKGSSAMPHKRNPIISENICGFARLLRGYAVTAMENIALWHERDISHSSTERIMLPDATMGLFYILKRMQTLLSGLNVYPENMRKNLNKTQDVICSGTLLLTLVDKGLTREQGYAIMQRLAFSAREKNISLEEVALKDEEIRKYMNEKEIKRDCDLSPHFKNVDFIFKRVFKK
jgi:adenylosuccinate lyase